MQVILNSGRSWETVKVHVSVHLSSSFSMIHTSLINPRSLSGYTTHTHKSQSASCSDRVGCLATRPPNPDPPSQARSLVFHRHPLTCHLGMRLKRLRVHLHHHQPPPLHFREGGITRTSPESPFLLTVLHFFFFFFGGVVFQVLSVNTEDGSIPRRVEGVVGLSQSWKSMSECVCMYNGCRTYLNLSVIFILD